MKTRLKPFTKFLLKKNLPYVIILVFLLILTAVILRVNMAKFWEERELVIKLRKEVDDLRFKRSQLALVINQPAINVVEDVKLLNQLVPDIENHFSIIGALEQLSQKTGFIITSYNVAVSPNQPQGKLSLKITGVGNQETFLEFLKNYNFGGGRLTTIDKITLQPGPEQAISIDMHFYHKDVKTITTDRIDYRKTLEKLKELKAKVNFVLKEEALPENVALPQKDNPFGQ